MTWAGLEAGIAGGLVVVLGLVAIAAGPVIKAGRKVRRLRRGPGNGTAKR